MSKTKESQTETRTVERAEFVKAPAEVIRRARSEGPILVTDSNGKPRGTISVGDSRRRG
jgi:hypothetical protein